MKIRIPDKFRSVKAAVAAVIGVLILIMIFWLSKSVFTTGSYYYPTETFVQLENGQPVSQVLYAPGDNPVLRSVSVLFATNARSNEGDVTVELMAGDDVICDWHIKASELLDNAIRGFEAPDGIKLSRDELYTIRITETFEGENNIAVGASSTGYLSCSMTTYDSSRCFKWFALMSLIFAAGYIVLILKGGFLDGSVSRIVITGIVSVLVIFILQFDFFPRISKTVASKPVPSATGVWDTIEPGASKEYSFSCRYDPFEDLEIFTNGENACDYEVTLVNDTTGVTYFDHMPVVPGWRVSTGRLCMMLSTEYSASGERYYDDGDYTLIITNTSADKAMEIELESPVEDGQTGVVAFAGLRSTTLGVKVATFAVILIFAYLIVLSVFRTAGRLTVERFYLITVIPLSVLYLIVFQPWTVPDCGAHFLASYRASNLLLGINGRLQWFARECDAVYYNGISWWTERKPDLEGIASMMHGIRQNSITTGLVDQLPHEDKMVYYSTLNWLPQSVGLAAGRLMRLGPALTVLIARVLTLITYIACTYRAVRNTPVGKSVFAALALLPVSLMMSSSFSYDCMVIIVALNFTAIILKLRAGYSRAGLIEAVIWAFLLGATKGGSVLLLLPLALLLIKSI